MVDISIGKTRCFALRVRRNCTSIKKEQLIIGTALSRQKIEAIKIGLNQRIIGTELVPEKEEPC
jgi:curli biogenesis system outer membrane secretion channel CsgG